jgi:murein DD-endopeptidase MepM/ murein hydrolase activator NlpD
VAIFPTLKGKKFGLVSLNDLAKKYFVDREIERTLHENPLLNPFEHHQMVLDFHRTREIDWSYGGYLEYRGDLLYGTYLDEKEHYRHLGIDLNVPAGTMVCSDMRGVVVHIFTDPPGEKHGWGTRVTLEIATGQKDEKIFLMYGHLARNHALCIGDILDEGWIIGNVGETKENGGWFPHLHVQAFVPPPYFSQNMLKKHLDEIDGYDHPLENTYYCTDPLQFIKLW